MPCLRNPWLGFMVDSGDMCVGLEGRQRQKGSRKIEMAPDSDHVCTLPPTSLSVRLPAEFPARGAFESSSTHPA